LRWGTDAGDYESYIAADVMDELVQVAAVHRTANGRNQ
jgi:hypothetical protein